MRLPAARDPLGAPPIGLGSSLLKRFASAETIDGLSTWATLAMIGLVRRRSMNARNWFSIYCVFCPASRGIGK